MQIEEMDAGLLFLNYFYYLIDSHYFSNGISPKNWACILLTGIILVGFVRIGDLACYINGYHGVIYSTVPEKNYVNSTLNDVLVLAFKEYYLGCIDLTQIFMDLHSKVCGLSYFIITQC